MTEIEQLVCESSHEEIALWKVVVAVIALFTPIMTVLRMADSEQPHMGIVYDQMSKLLSNCHHCSSTPIAQNATSAGQMYAGS